MNTKQERERRKAIWKAAVRTLPIQEAAGSSMRHARALAEWFEQEGLAPWQTPPAAPDLSAPERAVVDAAVAWWRNRNPETVGALALAVARHLDATTRAAP